MGRQRLELWSLRLKGGNSSHWANDPRIRVVGFEPTTACSQNRSAAKLHHTRIILPCQDLNLESPRSKRGMLPVTPQGNNWLPRLELNQHLYDSETSATFPVVHSAMNGCPSRTWTYNPRVNSALLCHWAMGQCASPPGQYRTDDLLFFSYRRRYANKQALLPTELPGDKTRTERLELSIFSFVIWDVIQLHHVLIRRRERELNPQWDDESHNCLANSLPCQ